MGLAPPPGVPGFLGIVVTGLAISLCLDSGPNPRVLGLLGNMFDPIGPGTLRGLDFFDSILGSGLNPRFLGLGMFLDPLIGLPGFGLLDFSNLLLGPVHTHKN